MGATGITRDREHRERVAEKHNAVETLKALRDSWLETRPEHDEYVIHLNQRIKKLENQLKNMRP
jgi:hypothetical protein